MDLTATLTGMNIATISIALESVLKSIAEQQHTNCRLNDRFPKEAKVIDSVIADIKKTLKSEQFKETHFKQQPIDLVFLTCPLNQSYVETTLRELEVLDDPFSIVALQDYSIRNKVVLIVRYFNGLTYTLLPIFAWNVKERQPEQLSRFSI